MVMENRLSIRVIELAIGKYYEWDLQSLEIKNILTAIIWDIKEGGNIWLAIDANLIYTVDRWKIYKYYVACPSDNTTWEEVIENLYNDVYQICESLGITIDEN